MRVKGAPGAWAFLAGFLTLAGLMHFIAPQFYRPLIPEALGDPGVWVYGSGVAEIVVGAALIPRRTRRPAALAAVALFVLVFPGNLQMAWDARDDSAVRQVATLARLPLQALLIWWALVVARAAKSDADR
ncbi:MAG: hypothetical protein LH645_01875 [Actinomycetia bacterium]|nr:hypothetical protein [Actinomycetes bacterium]